MLFFGPTKRRKNNAQTDGTKAKNKQTYRQTKIQKTDRQIDTNCKETDRTTYAKTLKQKRAQTYTHNTE